MATSHDPLKLFQEVIGQVSALDAEEAYSVFEGGPLKRLIGAVTGQASLEGKVRHVVGRITRIEETVLELSASLESRLSELDTHEPSAKALAEVANELDAATTKLIPDWKRQVDWLFRAHEQQAAIKYSADLPDIDPPARRELLDLLDRSLRRLQDA